MARWQARHMHYYKYMCTYMHVQQNNARNNFTSTIRRCSNSIESKKFRMTKICILTIKILKYSKQLSGNSSCLRKRGGYVCALWPLPPPPPPPSLVGWQRQCLVWAKTNYELLACWTIRHSLVPLQCSHWDARIGETQIILLRLRMCHNHPSYMYVRMCSLESNFIRVNEDLEVY